MQICLLPYFCEHAMPEWHQRIELLLMFCLTRRKHRFERGDDVAIEFVRRQHFPQLPHVGWHVDNAKPPQYRVINIDCRAVNRIEGRNDSKIWCNFDSAAAEERIELAISVLNIGEQFSQNCGQVSSS